MADHIGTAFGALAGAPMPGGGADLPLSPQWRQPFGRTTSMEQPMKSALIGPWDGNNSGAPASKPDAAAKQSSAAWRGSDVPSNRDPKWPEKDRPDYNAARDRPARWREREEDSRDRGNTWDSDRWGSVEEPRRWQDDRGSDRWGDSAGGRGRGRPPADDRWVDRKPSGTPAGEREWLPGMPPEPELPKRPSIQDRWGSESADRRSGEDRWRTPGTGGAPLAGGPGMADAGFTSTQAGRGRGFATGRGRGLKPSGPSAPGSGAPDRWDAPRGGQLDRSDSNMGFGGNGVGHGGSSQSSVRRYSSPVMSKIYSHMLSSHGEKLPMPRINPEVALQYSEYLSESVAEAAAQQLGGGSSSSGPVEHVGTGGAASAAAAAPGSQSQPPPPKLNPLLPVTHELYLQDQWLYKDPQGVTQGPFTRSDILDWLDFHYFGEDLPIRAAALEGAPFIPLGQMMKMWDAIERGRPLGPPGFTPSAPAAMLPSAAVDAGQQQQVAQVQQPAAAAITPLSSVSSMALSAAPSNDPAQPMNASAPAGSTANAAPGGTTQRTSSLLETLLGKKLASESPVQQPSAAGGMGSGLPGPLGGGAPLPQPDAGQQVGAARPFTLDPPVQLHSAASGGLGGGPLGSLGGLGGPLGSGLGGFGSGLPGAAGMGPGALGGMGGPSGMGPGPWGGPLGVPGGPLPGGHGGPVLPAWGRDPLVAGFDPLRRPDLHPGIHAGSGIWGSGNPFRPEGPQLAPGPFGPPAGVPGDAASGQHGLAPLPDALLGKPAHVHPAAPGPMQPTQAALPPPQPQQTIPGPLQQQPQTLPPQPPQTSAWAAAQVQPVAASRSLADIQREQAMEAARQASLAEAAAQQASVAPAPPAQEVPPPPQQAPSQQQPGAWAGAPAPEPYRPISGLPPALQQIFAAANKAPQAAGEAVPAEPQPPAVEAAQQSAPATSATVPANESASSGAAGSGGGKKKKTPQLVLQEQPKAPPNAPAPASVSTATTVTAVAAEDASAAGGQTTHAAAPPRPEPKLAPWASAAASKPPTAAMTLREIQMQEAEAAARAARAAAAAQEAASAQNAAAATTTAASIPAAPPAAPASTSPWAKIAAATPGPNAVVVNPPQPAAPAPPPASTAWRPVAPLPAPAAAAPAAVSTVSTVAADTSPSRKTASIASNAAAAVAPAARGGRPAAATAEPPSAPVGVTGTAPRGTTLAELLEKQLNPAPPAAAAAPPKAWGGAAAKPPPVTNLRAVLYEESAADLEGGAVEEDLSDVLPMLQQQKPLQPAPVSTNGGWAAAPAPPPGPTLRDIQQQEEEAARRRAAAATAAAPPARAASGPAPAASSADDEGLFWDYGPAAGTNVAAVRAASVESPKPAPAVKPAAPAPVAPVSTRGGWASAVGAAAAAPPPPTAAAVAAKAAAAPAARAPAAAVAAKSSAAVAAPNRPAALPAAPVASTSYAPAAPSMPSVDDSAGLLDGGVQMSPDFRNWCRSKMVEFFGNDDLSLVHFLLTVSSRSEVAEYCQMYMRGKPNVSTFVAEFLKRKDAELARQAAGAKGKNKGSGGGAAASGTAKAASSKGAAAVTEWQKASSGAQQAAASGKKAGNTGGKQPVVKKVAGITATVPGFSLLSDRA